MIATKIRITKTTATPNATAIINAHSLFIMFVCFLRFWLQKYNESAKQMSHWWKKMFQIWEISKKPHFIGIEMGLNTEFFSYDCFSLATSRNSLHVMPYALRNRRAKVARLGIPDISPMMAIGSLVVLSSRTTCSKR